MTDDNPMADRDPMDDPDRCTATASSTGERCKQPAIPGGNVCRFHGGSAGQVQKKAQERLDEMADSVTAELQQRLDDVFDRLDDLRSFLVAHRLPRRNLGHRPPAADTQSVVEGTDVRAGTIDHQ